MYDGYSGAGAVLVDKHFACYGRSLANQACLAMPSLLHSISRRCVHIRMDIIYIVLHSVFVDQKRSVFLSVLDYLGLCSMLRILKAFNGHAS